jgi:predicted acyltransferase
MSTAPPLGTSTAPAEVAARPALDSRPGSGAERLLSLDVFRGITLAAMLIVNNPGVGEPYAPLKHSIWNGRTLADLVFPFFLFIVGVAIPFSLAKRSAGTQQTRPQILGQIWLRALTLLVLGLLQQAIPLPGDRTPDGFLYLNIFRLFCLAFVYASILVLLIPFKPKRLAIWLPVIIGVAFCLLAIAKQWVNQHALASGLPQDFKLGSGIFNPERMRIPGILQRIGLCYGVAATVSLFWGWRTALATVVVLLAGYSVLMLAVPLPGHVAGSLSMEDNFARTIDDAVFNKYTTLPDGTRQVAWWHTYPYPDNEGLLATLPAIGTTLLGLLLGIWLRTSRPSVDRCAAILAMGVILAVLGRCLDWWLMPINKIIWTPSFVVFTAGLATLGLGTVFWIADVLGRRRWTLPFVVLGRNSITGFIVDTALPALCSFVSPHIGPGGQKIQLRQFFPEAIAAALHHVNTWLQHISPHFPMVDGPGNTSLAYSLVFALTILLMMSVLYVFKIFVKV